MTTTDNVGIGTSTPSTKFEVSNGHGTNPSNLIYNPNSGTLNVTQSTDDTGSNKWPLIQVMSKRQAGTSSTGGGSRIVAQYDASGVLPETQANQGGIGIRTESPHRGVLSFGNSNSDYSIYNSSTFFEVNSEGTNKFAMMDLDTDHADHFKWQFDGSEKMRINSAGNVGIGTASINSNLHVSGGALDSELLIEADTDNSNEMDNPFITLSQDMGYVKGFIGLVGNNNTAAHVEKHPRSSEETPGNWVQKTDYPGTLGNYMLIGMNHGEGVQFGTWGEVRMTVHKNGSVGVGTNSPTYAKLQIKGGATHELFAVNRPNSDVPALYLGNRGNNDAAIAANNSNLTIGRDNGGTYTEYMRVQNGTGNVGIGRTNPDNKLDVAGTIRAEEVKVEALPWPDYVFSDTYELSSLSEVAGYIDENGHLPNIPSAKEVEENGIKLGEMNARLLEKIEELTLYLIQQNEKIDNQQNEIEILKTKIK